MQSPLGTGISDGLIFNACELEDAWHLEDKGDSICEIVLGLYSRMNSGNVVDALVKAFSLLDGEYACAFSLGGRLFLARDPVGTRPLFFSHHPFMAFASERKALWGCGCTDVEAVLPGHLLDFEEGASYPFRVQKERVLHSSFSDAAVLLEEKLRTACARRAGDAGKVGILFSGGLDSTLLACLTRDPELFCCGTAYSSDMQHAREAASALTLPLHEIAIDEDDVRQHLQDVMHACESRRPLNIGIALPLSLAAREASRRVDVLFLGSGADELFGGYSKYRTHPGLMSDDVRTLARDNLERDNMALSMHGVEARHPFLDRDVIAHSLGLPHEFLFDGDGGGKKILREVALHVGVPEVVCRRKKTAVQYGSGVLPLLKRLARSYMASEEARRRGFLGPLDAYTAHLWETVAPRFSSGQPSQSSK